jgi:RNA polymerase sigma factor (sigma-70 family)
LLSDEMNDNELLRSYVNTGSEPAFAELVQRHISLVYSAALRQVDGDAGLAQDVTQAVFTDLARKARRLTGHTSLMGWLYTSTRYLAANARRTESRRRARELEATAMTFPDSSNPEPTWTELRPVLDDAMHDLNEADREAVLLRYFDQRSLGEIGARLGLGENAARMKVNRALEKLRNALQRRGVTSTTAALVVILPVQAIAAMPAGLAPRIARAVLAEASPGGILAATAALILSAKGWVVLGVLSAALLVTSFAVRQAFETTPDPGLPIMVSDNEADETESADFVDAISSFAAVEIASADAERDFQGLRLLILSAEDGTPLANAPVEVRRWEGARFRSGKFVSDADGICEVPIPVKTTDFQLTTRLEGFADTRLQWRPD